MTDENIIIEVSDLKINLGGTWIHDGINLTVQRGEILGVVGGSGAGKTTLLRELLGLEKPNSGSIRIFGKELLSASPAVLSEIQHRWGVLFQQNALFSSLTVLENTAFPLNENTALDKETIHELAMLKTLLAGLPSDAIHKFPSELSGGMQKRAGLARAIVLDPELIFLDEPTSGLDPNTASGFDELILNLQTTMGLTIVIITHDLDSLWRITNRVVFLGEGKVISVAPIAELMKNPHPLIQEFFHGVRGKAAQRGYENNREIGDGH